MLSLSRKKGESLYIDDDIEVTVGRVGGGRAVLQVKAPRHRQVTRSELGRPRIETKSAEGTGEKCCMCESEATKQQVWTGLWFCDDLACWKEYERQAEPGNVSPRVSRLLEEAGR